MNESNVGGRLYPRDWGAETDLEAWSRPSFDTLTPVGPNR
jgi:hypothetical protein